MSVEKDIRIKYKDLQADAKAVYTAVAKLLKPARGLGGVEVHEVPPSTAAKLYDVQLKAIRLQAELREKALRPEQLDSLETQLRRVEERIASHHAGGIHGPGTQSVRPGDGPAWEQ